MKVARSNAAASVGLVGLVCLASACFYTGGVNTEPKAEIRETSVGPYNMGDPVTFVASKSEDQDGDALVAEWWHFECADASGQVCPTPANPPAKQTLGLNETYTLYLGSKRAVRVVLTVTDPLTASDQDSEVILVLNRPPVGSLQVQGTMTPTGGFPLGTPVDILLSQSDPDGDALTSTWTVEPPSNSVPGDVTFTKVTDTHYKLDADVKGVWKIHVELDDGEVKAPVSETILFEADSAPCVGTTDPLADPNGRYIIDTDDEVRRFSVLSVNDDLDHFPPPDPGDPILGTAAFRWYLATPDTAGAFVELSGHTVNDYVLDPSAFAPGDEISIRVEIDDRAMRTLPCDAASPTCSLGGDACLQRVTWGVEVR